MPTHDAVVVVCTGAYLLRVSRRRCAALVLGGPPFLVVLMAYNYHYFGHPLAFGQSVVAPLLRRATGKEWYLRDRKKATTLPPSTATTPPP